MIGARVDCPGFPLNGRLIETPPHTGAGLHVVVAPDGRVASLELVVLECRMPLVKGRGTGPETKPSPRLPLKNLYFQIFRRGPRATLGRDKTADGWIELLRELRFSPAIVANFPTPATRKHERPEPIIRDGYWRFDTFHAVPRRRVELDVLLPLVDSDAVLAPSRDLLQEGGILDADARIVGDSTCIGLRARGQLFRARLWRLDDPDDVVGPRWHGERFIDLEEPADA